MPAEAQWEGPAAHGEVTDAAETRPNKEFCLLFGVTLKDSKRSFLKRNTMICLTFPKKPLAALSSTNDSSLR